MAKNKQILGKAHEIHYLGHANIVKFLESQILLGIIDFSLLNPTTSLPVIVSVTYGEEKDEPSS